MSSSSSSWVQHHLPDRLLIESLPRSQAFFFTEAIHHIFDFCQFVAGRAIEKKEFGYVFPRFHQNLLQQLIDIRGVVRLKL
jgi:hypothetical protein